MLRPLLISALMAFCHSSLWPGLPTIGPEVWAVKESDTKGSGAIILERSLRIHAQSVEQTYLIRVLNDHGKGLIEFPAFSSSARVEGRTVLRDGAETPFNASSDFQVKPLIEFGGTSLNRKLVIPPGLTSDCVIQVQWVETASFIALGGFWDYKVQERWFFLASRLPTRRMELEVFADVGWAYDLQSGSRGSMIVDRTNSRAAVFTDLPAYEWIPYSEGSSREIPTFILYQQPRYLMDAAVLGEKSYWDKVANSWWRPYYENKFQFGKMWGGFSEDIRNGLPSSKQAAALELHRRLLRKIRDTSALLPEEGALRTAKQNQKKIDPRDFGETIKSGETNHNGILLLYWVLLGHANIPVKPVLVVDREVRRFRSKQCNLAQIDRTLFLIEEAGKPPLFLEPGRSHGDPAIIHPNHQGTEGVVLIPGEPWTFQIMKIPFQDGSRDRMLTEIQIGVSEEKDQIQLSCTYTGIPEWYERARWWPLLPEERDRTLKESLAKKDASVQVESATIPALSLSPFLWSVVATRERDASRHLEINPFPLVEPPVFIPKDLPDQRREPIVMPWIGTQSIRSVIKAPVGYRFAGIPDFQRSNTFGEVTWNVTAAESKSPVELLVTYDVRIKARVSDPSAYPQFKEFLSWVGETANRTLVLTKVSR